MKTKTKAPNRDEITVRAAELRRIDEEAMKGLDATLEKLADEARAAFAADFLSRQPDVAKLFPELVIEHFPTYAMEGAPPKSLKLGLRSKASFGNVDIEAKVDLSSATRDLWEKGRAIYREQKVLRQTLRGPTAAYRLLARKELMS